MPYTETMRVPFLKKVLYSQRGQGMVEYILVIVVIVTIVFVVGKPFFTKYGNSISKGLQSGIFQDDSTGAGFYTFSVN